MLVTQHITSRMADDLIAKGIPFLDTAGNAYLHEPEATIMIVGRDKPALNLKNPTSRSTTPKGLRVTFALLTQPGLVHAPYRTIADRSVVALNTVNLAMDDLIYRGLVVHKGASGHCRSPPAHRGVGESISNAFASEAQPMSLYQLDQGK